MLLPNWYTSPEQSSTGSSTSEDFLLHICTSFEEWILPVRHGYNITSAGFRCAAMGCSESVPRTLAVGTYVVPIPPLAMRDYLGNRAGRPEVALRERIQPVRKGSPQDVGALGVEREIARIRFDSPAFCGQSIYMI